MGPVSFEPLDVGAGRDEAMVVARRLARAGIRVVSMTSSETASGPRWRLLIRSGDGPAAQRLLDADD